MTSLAPQDGTAPPGLLPVAEAQARLLALVPALPSEDLPLARAAGRWLVRPVAARRDQPPFDASAMDGYAVAGDPAPGAVLTLIGTSAAGAGFAGQVVPGQAVRIFTGAPLPAGATRVVIQENTRAQGDEIALTAAETSTNIRPRGQDFAAGATLAPRRLRPADLALLAAMGAAQVPVARRPVVAFVSTGDELVQPGEIPRDDQIFASNAVALAALAQTAGAETRILPIAPDRPEALAETLRLAAGADVIVTIGGASVGDHDLVGRVTGEMGLAPAFWKIAMRPGKPLLAGRLGGAVLLGLPGNPVSALVTAQLFLLPLLRALQGDAAPLPVAQPARLAIDLPANGPRTHYMRARLSGGTITPFDRQDSALLTILTEADALLIRPPAAPEAKAGAGVEYLPL